MYLDHMSALEGYLLDRIASLTTRSLQAENKLIMAYS